MPWSIAVLQAHNPGAEEEPTPQGEPGKLWGRRDGLQVDREGRPYRRGLIGQWLARVRRDLAQWEAGITPAAPELDPGEPDDD